MIYFCAISNISSGSCKEDCSFCTQSVHNRVDIDIYKSKPIETILQEAKIAKKNFASGFCLVTSGKGLNSKKLDFVCRATKAIKKEIPDLNIIACNGLATFEELKELKKNQVDSYNHNLETSKEFYKQICTTHDWQERYQTCLDIKSVGLKLCSGGIFGMGESSKDRDSFIKALKELNPDSVPINFFHPNPSLPLKPELISKEEAISIIKLVKKVVNPEILMVAGGRELVFKDRLDLIFESGANAIVIGNYLTTKGDSPNKDIELVESFGYKIATKCNGE